MIQRLQAQEAASTVNNNNDTTNNNNSNNSHHSTSPNDDTNNNSNGGRNLGDSNPAVRRRSTSITGTVARKGTKTLKPQIGLPSLSIRKLTAPFSSNSSSAKE